MAYWQVHCTTSLLPGWYLGQQQPAHDHFYETQGSNRRARWSHWTAATRLQVDDRNQCRGIRCMEHNDRKRTRDDKVGGDSTHQPISKQPQRRIGGGGSWRVLSDADHVHRQHEIAGIWYQQPYSSAGSITRKPYTLVSGCSSLDSAPLRHSVAGYSLLWNVGDGQSNLYWYSGKKTAIMKRDRSDWLCILGDHLYSQWTVLLSSLFYSWSSTYPFDIEYHTWIPCYLDTDVNRLLRTIPDDSSHQ